MLKWASFFSDPHPFCCPCFCHRFAGTILLLLFIQFILACVSFRSSTLLRRACGGSHHGIVLSESRVKILGVCSLPIAPPRRRSVREAKHAPYTACLGTACAVACRGLRCVGANTCQTPTTLLLTSKLTCACVRVGHRCI